jgi:hypothetical protein
MFSSPTAARLLEEKWQEAQSEAIEETKKHNDVRQIEIRLCASAAVFGPAACPSVKPQKTAVSPPFIRAKEEAREWRELA